MYWADKGKLISGETSTVWAKSTVGKSTAGYAMSNRFWTPVSVVGSLQAEIDKKSREIERLSISLILAEYYLVQEVDGSSPDPAELLDYYSALHMVVRDIESVADDADAHHVVTWAKGQLDSIERFVIQAKRVFPEDTGL